MQFLEAAIAAQMLLAANDPGLMLSAKLLGADGTIFLH
jgi:hypothetical protein